MNIDEKSSRKCFPAHPYCPGKTALRLCLRDHRSGMSSTIAKSSRFPGQDSCVFVFLTLNRIRMAAVFEKANALVSSPGSFPGHRALHSRTDFVELLHYKQVPDSDRPGPAIRDSTLAGASCQLGHLRVGTTVSTQPGEESTCSPGRKVPGR